MPRVTTSSSVKAPCIQENVYPQAKLAALLHAAQSAGAIYITIRWLRHIFGSAGVT
jgi:hypothetical protein